MNFKRVWQSLRLYTILSGKKRADYARKKNIYNSIGNNVSIMDRKVPLYPKCIKFHNNIVVASKVLFVTHDATHKVLNNYLKDNICQEVIGCIEVCDNVFIGSNVTILNNVKIGPNSIVAAGSLVNRDIPPNSICAGVPAKIIGTFDDYVEKRKNELYPKEFVPKNQELNDDMLEFLWKKFDSDKR